MSARVAPAIRLDARPENRAMPVPSAGVARLHTPARPERVGLGARLIREGTLALNRLFARPAQRVLAQRLGAATLAALTYLAVMANTGAHGPLKAPAMALAATMTDAPAGGVEPMPFERPGDSFPGSAFYYMSADADQPAPAADPLAPDAHWDGAATATADGLMQPGPAARALAQAGSQIDRTRALSCLTAAIYYEAASEPDAGQRAVAQVVLNRVAHPSFPKTVCGVVYQGSERTTGCQFTFTCDGSLARKPMALFWNRAEAVARAALAGYVYAPVGLATHYHTFAVHPYWDASMAFIGQIGAHRFFRFEGPAGESAAFRFAYAGGEPLAAPHPRAATPAHDAPADPLAEQRAYEASLKAAQGNPALVHPLVATYAPPAYTPEVMRHGGDAAYRAANLPESRVVQPEYQGSGNWIAQPE